MAQQIINIGTSANDGTGDTLRESQRKAKENFAELYTGKQNQLTAGTNITINITDPLNPVISASGGGGGSETTTTMGALINASTVATPNDTDFVATAESAGLLKKITWTNVKAFLKTYFDTLYAALASPTFTGTPAAPTATVGTNTTQLATTAFVLTNATLKPIQVTAQTLTAGSWTLVSGLYEYNLSNADITTISIVDVIPDNASVAIVQVAQVLPRTLSGSGTVKLYSTNLPTGNIIVTINIWK